MLLHLAMNSAPKNTPELQEAQSKCTSIICNKCKKVWKSCHARSRIRWIDGCGTDALFNMETKGRRTLMFLQLGCPTPSYQLPTLFTTTNFTAVAIPMNPQSFCAWDLTQGNLNGYMCKLVSFKMNR